MSKVGDYQQVLAELDNWDEYLRAESHLPGPRGNLELSAAYANLAAPEVIWRHAQIGADQAPENTPDCFLAFCGTRALGRLTLEGDRQAVNQLRTTASDARWRCREAVAIALQRVGEGSFDELARIIDEWSRGNRYEQRAAVAAICEPALLQDPTATQFAIRILDRITGTIQAAEDRRGDPFRTLRKSLGYGWSVVVAARPEAGKPAFERWLMVDDPDLRWVARQNLSKARLRRIDPTWVQSCQRRISS